VNAKMLKCLNEEMRRRGDEEKMRRGIV